MKIRCIYNTGNALRVYENEVLEKTEFGRFGASENTLYGEIEVGKEYLVMGIIAFQSYLAYLIDDNGTISACPCQLFEIVDNTLSRIYWHFRLIEKMKIYIHMYREFGDMKNCAPIKIPMKI